VEQARPMDVLERGGEENAENGRVVDGERPV
jgi:hypothetical protein